MKTDKLIALLGLAAGAWYLYTRSRGMTFLGENAYPMLREAGGNQMSLVSPNTSTSTAATNVFSAITKGLAAIFGSLAPNAAKAGNAPRIASAGSTISPADVSLWGLQVPRDEPPPPSTSAAYPSDAGTLNQDAPFWSWNPTMGIPTMSWTLNPAILGYDPNYIPPPPGS
jgi:hypothetical protein